MMLHGFPEETPSDLNHFRQMRVDLRALTGASLACPLPTPRKRTQDRTERTRRFLRSIAVPEPQIAEIEPLGATHSQAELFSSISLLRANGCAWKLIPEAIKDSREPNIEFASILFARRSEFRLPSLRYYGRLRDAQFNTNTTASLESRPPFECDFLGYSCTTLPLLPHVKAESDGFGLHLLPEAERKFQQLPLLKHDPLHIYGPHAYLRYYTIPETNQIIVTHIQCRSIDLHPDLPDSRRFMDVARVLMAGFEHFISSTNYYGTEPCIVFAPRCVLSVEGARYSPLITGRELTGLRDTQRWKDAYAEVLRVFERELLKDGYEDTVYLQRLQVFDKQGHPIIPGRLLCKQATKSRYAPYISELKRNRFSLWYKVGMKICASVTKDHEVQEGARRARTASAQAHFEARVHRTNPALAAIPGMDLIEIVPQMVDGTLSGHESALGKDGVAILLREIERVHGKHPIPFRLGWLSRGGQHVTKDWTVLADKRSKGTHFIPLHLEGMDRHPTIAIAEHDHNGNLCRAAFVGMKAGGLRELLPCHDVHPAPAGVELPIYASKRGGQPWGGAFLHDVFKEACHLQSLHMGVLFTYGHAAAAPMPILSGQPMRLPFRPDGRLEWVECKDYIKKFMGKDGEDLGVLKIISKASIRVVQLFDRLFVQTLETARAPQLLKEEIDTIIALLYQFNGEIFNAPQTTRTLSFTHNTRRNIERYLQECARANATKAQRIIDRIERTSLRTLGVLHGSGGHGGGDYNPKLGVFSGADGGGCCEKRNVTIAGELNDFETGILIPWENVGIPEKLVPYFSKPIAPNELQHHQQADLHDWQNTMHIIRGVLFGLPFPKDPEQQRMPFGAPGKIVSTDTKPLSGARLHSGWVLQGTEKKCDLSKLDPKDILSKCIQPIRFVEPDSVAAREYHSARRRGQYLIRNARLNRTLLAPQHWLARTFNNLMDLPAIIDRAEEYAQDKELMRVAHARRL